MAFTLTFDADSWQVVIEDDDRTCYAYLIRGESIVADVWLCNRTDDPITAPEWESPNARDLMPFRNPPPYVSVSDLGVHQFDPNSLAVSWQFDGEAVSAVISEDGNAVGALSAGKKPGRSIRAALDGPLASRLVEEIGGASTTQL